VPRLRKVGAIPLLPYTLSRCAKRNIYLLFSLEFNSNNNNNNNNNTFLLLIACL
jgi:hypothetical protein